jgi:tetratricopeptide (TPR) repeat protein
VLFDLQSPGRRRVIKVVYSLLAILLFVGLVGFGIGSSVSGGGLSDIFGGGGGSSSGFEGDIKDAQAKVDANPKNAQAQLALARLYLQQAQTQLDADPDTGQTVVTSDAEESYNKAADAWDAYLKRKPAKPDAGAALQIAGAFFLLAQNSTSAADARAQVEAAAKAQRVAVDANPSAGNLNNLALYLYFSGETAKADQAAAEAIAKQPKSSQAQLQKQFDSIRKQAKAFQKQVTLELKQGAAGQGNNPLESSGGTLGGGLGGP